MIREIDKNAKALEFTSFRKKENVSDDDLIKAVLQFENELLSSFNGIIFHCLVRNFDHQYANVLLARDKNVFTELAQKANESKAALHFFSLIESESVKMNFQSIEKDNFVVPAHFSCVEYGTFALKDATQFPQLLEASTQIEKEYLSKTENTQAHCIGQIEENMFAEVTFGTTLGKTKEICMGYLENEHCQPLLAMTDDTTMQLDFWYLIA